jgi:cob(I)alamin adenosyltransferase
VLYGGGRIPKDDPRTEAYGTIDEAVAALGLARAELRAKEQLGVLTPALAEVEEIVLSIQRGLFVVGAEMATAPEARGRLEDDRTRVSAAMVERLTRLIVDLEHRIDMPREFVLPGETRTSAGLELARTVIRRAERRAVGLTAAGILESGHLLPYLNRLADLVWVLARAAEQAEARTSTPARAGGTHRTKSARELADAPGRDAR